MKSKADEILVSNDNPPQKNAHQNLQTLLTERAQGVHRRPRFVEPVQQCRHRRQHVGGVSRVVQYDMRQHGEDLGGLLGVHVAVPARSPLDVV